MAPTGHRNCSSRRPQWSTKSERQQEQSAHNTKIIIRHVSFKRLISHYKCSKGTLYSNLRDLIVLRNTCPRLTLRCSPSNHKYTRGLRTRNGGRAANATTIMPTTVTVYPILQLRVPIQYFKRLFNCIADPLRAMLGSI